MNPDTRAFLASPEEIIEEAKAGRMFILVDDEDRENEGDLIIPASACTADAVNFMARFARGLICLAMERKQIERLNLPLMARRNNARHETAFTVSIEAREGVTTGISAADRARTVAVATAPDAKSEDIVTPGHVFPLVARDGGVLVRTGHTEASVDIARLAGLTPAAVICEIMNEDGTMARMPDLIPFAQYHGLKLGTIADLIAYRRRTETTIERRASADVESRFGGRFQAYVYVDVTTGIEHMALVRGEVKNGEPVLVRMHAVSVLDDVLGVRGSQRDGELELAMETIATEGCGVVVLLRDGSSSLAAALASRVAEGGAVELRDYGVGAQILLDLGVRRMVLLSNHRKSIISLEGYGLTVEGQRPIPVAGRDMACSGTEKGR